MIKPAGNKPLWQKTRRISLVLLLIVVGVAFVRSYVGTFTIVDGFSMCPTFDPADVVQAKTSYVAVQRGDVVIVRDEQGEQMIKRVIGLPGEVVGLYGGFVYINRVRLAEPYLAPLTFTFKSDPKDQSPAFCQLEDGQYFVMGDNRRESFDSRNYGPVNARQIVSVVETPENSPQPGFSQIMLTIRDGKPEPVFTGKSGRPNPPPHQAKHSAPTPHRPTLPAP